MTAWIWLLMGLIGIAALGAFIYYGQYKDTHPAHSRREDQKRDRATRKVYADAERERVVERR